MAHVAAPAYLGDDFSTAPPGHRFSLYLPYWVRGTWAREPDKAAGKGGLPVATGKAPTFQSVVAMGQAFTASNRALVVRQSAIAAPLNEQGAMLTLHAEAVAPFTTGLGNEHPLENGFAFLNPYGLPYLPGSGVKGVLRQASRELIDHHWGSDQGWSADAVDALFGKTGETTDADGAAELQRGALTFWDVLPQIDGDALQVEVMTPHQNHYHQNDATPHESGQPNPIHFLTVPPGSKFTFHVQCDLAFLASLPPDLASNGAWQHLMNAAFVHAFQWLGFGAKTAVGYGAMKEDLDARRACELQATQRREAAQAAAREQALSEMSPQQREQHEAGQSLAEFRAALDTERQLKRYKKGSAFDELRNAFLRRAMAWTEPTLRADAARALREAYKFTDWPGNSERKKEVKLSLTALDGQP